MSVDVTIDRLCVSLGGERILNEVSLHVPAGSFVTLLGPSGSGKTTTLNVIAGFVGKESGTVRLGEQVIDDLPPHERNIGFLFQNYALFPHMTVAKNIEFPLIARKVPSPQRRKQVAEILELVRLPKVAKRSVRSLSGGQQQRIALARALVFGPQVLLLDEPLAALDKQLRETMQLELKRIQHETGTTTIAVTHDQVEAMSMADAVAIMNGGRLVQIGTPEDVYRRPADLFVATFLGEANLLPVEGGRVRAFGTPVAAGVADPVAVVRPEDVDVVDAATPGAVRATVLSEVFQGTRRRLTLRVGGIEQPVVVSATPHGAAESADGLVHLRLPESRAHVVAGGASSKAVGAGATDPDAVEALTGATTELARH
jgi:putative spermidine/putrescine transport system ATP-binding protein